MTTNRNLLLCLAALLALTFTPLRADDNNTDVTIKSSDGQTQLVMPDGWASQHSSNRSAALEARNEDSSAFVMVVVSDRSDPYMPLDDYAKERRDEVLSHLVNARFNGPDDLQVAGFKALQYELHGTSPASKIDFAYYLTVVQMRRHYLEIVCWTT